VSGGGRQGVDERRSTGEEFMEAGPSDTHCGPAEALRSRSAARRLGTPYRGASCAPPPVRTAVLPRKGESPKSAHEIIAATESAGRHKRRASSPKKDNQSKRRNQKLSQAPRPQRLRADENGLKRSAYSDTNPQSERAAAPRDIAIDATEKREDADNGMRWIRPPVCAMSPPRASSQAILGAPHRRGRRTDTPS
jgi:hypothetical protein